VEAEVEIESLAAGGDGVGRLPDGRIAFVRLAAPGDRLRIAYPEAPESKARFVRARIVEILERGAARVEPACRVFGSCGGCAWQHIDYATQLEAKRRILVDALRRIGGLTQLPEIEIVASPDPFHYRSRTRLHVSRDAVGYRRWKSHEIEKIRSCPILLASLDQALGQLADDQAAGLLAGAGFEEGEWELAAGAGGMLRSRPLPGHGPEKGAEVDSNLGSGPRRVEIAVADDRIAIGRGGFSQGNELLRPELHRRVVAAVTAAGSGFALELFAGAGFFTLALARSFDMVIAVESFPSAVKDLQHNLASQRLDNVEVRGERSEESLLGWDGLRPDVVLLDPPRSGLEEEGCRALASLGARRIVYLSCDPATLARDLKRLTSASEGRYRCHEITGFDLFPQTPHVEVLAVLDASPCGALDELPI